MLPGQHPRHVRACVKDVSGYSTSSIILLILYVWPTSSSVFEAIYTVERFIQLAREGGGKGSGEGSTAGEADARGAGAAAAVVAQGVGRLNGLA